MLALHRFQPRLIQALRGYTKAQLIGDLGAGLTVGIVALPLAMAFAIASGLKPEQGIFTAVIAGFLIAALGGSNVQIGGPAGAFIVIVYGIQAQYGLANLIIATMLAGVLLFALGLLRLGALVRYIPVGIVIGFTNGIAVLIGLSQLKDLLGLRIAKMPADFFAQIHALWTHIHTLNPAALAMGLGSLALVVVWPKSYAMPTAPIGLLQKLRRHAAQVPGTVIALVLATVTARVAGLDVETIGSRFGGIPQSLPAFALPAFEWTSVKQLLMPTLTIALLGAIESLLCARVADNMSDLPRHDPNQELMAQGVANFVAPLFGGMPATGTIARTSTNVRSGAHTPVAGMVHALVLLAIVLVAAPLAAHVPLSALAGILLFVAWNMGEWHEFARLRQFKLPYRTVMVGSFVLTVVFDLTVAVEAGLLMACGFFILRMSDLFRVEPLEVPKAPPGVRVMQVYGALFFGAVGKLEPLAAQLPPHTRVLVLEMHRLVALDTTGVDALTQLARDLQRRGVGLILAELNEQPLSLLQRAGLEDILGARCLFRTLQEALAVQAAQEDEARTA
ncbi:SulP family inorganic anion transporter [Azohydromonas lata]|uniref:SulP family inorganic anion transporter n=1 Tax=Azohydromonas lata TaxID=45677 RepID=A0ABU5IGJ3_9BURK|nr:SulP family inorganic anion transporter [Azohydromonas lata]MDZ5457656.1 SulP family inorganic anion transporter [Azohydromonas lata]